MLLRPFARSGGAHGTPAGRTEDAAKYEALHKRAVDAFRNEYVTPNGMLVSDTQTAYTLALMFDLLPEAQRAGAANVWSIT